MLGEWNNGGFKLFEGVKWCSVGIKKPSEEFSLSTVFYEVF